MYEDSPDDLIHDVFLQTMWQRLEPGRADDRLRRYRRAHHAGRSARSHARPLRAEFGRRRGGRERRARTLRRTRLRAVCRDSRDLARCPYRSAPQRRRPRACDIRTASRPTSSSVLAASTSATNAVMRSRCSTRFSAAACRAGSFKRYANSAGSSIASTRFKPAIARPDFSASTRELRRRTFRRASTSFVEQFARVRTAADRRNGVPPRQGAHQGQSHAFARVDLGPDDSPRP